MAGKLDTPVKHWKNPFDTGNRSGLILFLWNLTHNFMTLVIANLLFVLGSLGVVTIGPSLAALHYICGQLAAGRPPVYLWREFWQAFKENFVKGLLAELVFVAYSFVLWWALRLLEENGYVGFPLYLLLMIVTLFFLMCYSWVFPQIAMLDIPLGACFINAVSLALVRPLHALGAALISAGLVVGAFFLLPATLMVYIVLLFAVAALVKASFVWPVLERFLIKNDEEDCND